MEVKLSGPSFSENVVNHLGLSLNSDFEICLPTKKKTQKSVRKG